MRVAPRSPWRSHRNDIKRPVCSMPCRKVVKEKSQASSEIFSRAQDSAKRVRRVFGLPGFPSTTTGLTMSGEMRLAAFPGSFVTCNQAWHGTNPEDLKEDKVTASSSPRNLGPSVQELSQPFQFRKISAGDGQLVITDVVLPDESGLDLIPKIKKIRPNIIFKGDDYSIDEVVGSKVIKSYRSILDARVPARSQDATRTCTGEHSLIIIKKFSFWLNRDIIGAEMLTLNLKDFVLSYLPY